MVRPMYVLIAVLFAIAPSISGQVGVDDAAIRKATADGSKTKPGKIGLFMKVSASENLLKNNAPTYLQEFTLGQQLGMSIHVPETWIALHSSMAKAEYRSFGPADVSADMREPILRILVKPVFIDRVVIRSVDEAGVVEVVGKTPCRQAMPFEENVAACNEFRFSLTDVEGVRRRDKKGEFLITIFATGQNNYGTRQTRGSKDFKVKTKHLEDLGWSK